MVEELAVLGGPSNLHHPWCNDGHLVVPNPRVDAECASHALEGGGVASCLGRPAGQKVSTSETSRQIPNRVTLGLTSSPVGEILRYSLTSLLLSMALMLARLTFSYVNCRPSFKTKGVDRRAKRSARDSRRMEGAHVCAFTHTDCRDSTVNRTRPASSGSRYAPPTTPRRPADC